MDLKDLNEFKVPNSGLISLCEIDGRMQLGESSYSDVNLMTSKLEKHPKIHITTELLHAVSSGDEGRAVFLPVNVSFLKQISQVYHEQGLTEALRTAIQHTNPVIAKTAMVILGAVSYVNKFKLIIDPSLNYQGALTINEYAQTRQWLHHSVRCIAWHPYTTKIAICTSDDSIRIYSNDSLTTVLRCKHQKNVTCLAWRPLSISEIAVGHENGIIIWNIDPHSLVARPSSSNATMLYKKKHRPVMSLCWSPRGEILVSAAACDNTLYVWDVELNLTSILKKPGTSGNIMLRWSPCGSKLFSASSGIVFRVWNCRNWECERWTVGQGRVQAACWTKCGTNLLFATNNEPVIYALVVRSETIFTSDVATSHNQALPIFDLSKIEKGGVVLGGLVQNMEIDPSGNHLAVLFQETNCIAVFHITKQNPVEIMASSLVMGICPEVPTTINFQQDFDAGACLTIGWSSGRIQYYPIIYSDLATYTYNSAMESGNLHSSSFGSNLLSNLI